jgi:alkylhydroperoxidase family enzyme
VEEECSSGEEWLAKAVHALKNKAYGELDNCLKSAFEQEDSISSLAVAYDLRGSLNFLKGSVDDALADFAQSIAHSTDDTKLQLLGIIKQSTVWLEKGECFCVY